MKYKIVYSHEAYFSLKPCEVCLCLINEFQKSLDFVQKSASKMIRRTFIKIKFFEGTIRTPPTYYGTIHPKSIL